MKWYVAVVGINRENLAKNGLLSKGFECYVPMGKKTIRHARQQKIRTFPVFSRYIFIKFNIDDPHYSEPIRSTDGIIDIISNNWQPVEIPAWIIEDIQEREACGQFDIIPKHNPKKYKWSKSFQVLKSLLNPDTVIHV